MSINQYCYYSSSTSSSSEQLHQEPHWWSLSPHPISAAAAPAMLSVDLNNNDDGQESAESMETCNTEQQQQNKEEEVVTKERLFEKPLTPSDVGKLNRLVIPKQHAEKHFPMNGSGGGDAGEHGLLLGFEDELGKSWRFRYSYWNSSQSYVLTKGWSRFVKEKRLDAGDIVVFARHRVETGRLFIGWRRRNSGGEVQAVVSGGSGWSRVACNPYPNQQQIGHLPEPRFHAAAGSPQQSQTAAASAGGGGNSKRLRLFGVNLECQLAADDSEPSTPVGSPISSQGQAHHLHYHPANHHQYYSNHMDMISFSGSDVYRQG